MNALLADAIIAERGYGFGDLVIWIVVICAVLGIAWVATKQAGITVPPFIVQIAWIVLAAVVAVLAIRFLLSL